jgi:hypothetical protein
MFSKKACGQMQTTVTQTHVQLRHSTQQQQQQYSGSNNTTTDLYYYYFRCTRKTKQNSQSGLVGRCVVSNTTNKQRYDTRRDETRRYLHNTTTAPGNHNRILPYRAHPYAAASIDAIFIMVVSSSRRRSWRQTADNTKRFSNNKKLHVQQHGNDSKPRGNII